MRGRAGLAKAVHALVGVMALAVFPAKAWLDQRANHERLVAQEAALSAQNRTLQERVDQLRSDDEIERLARQYNLIKPGEEAYFLLPQRGATTVPVRPPAPEPSPAPAEPRSLWDRIASIF